MKIVASTGILWPEHGVREAIEHFGRAGVNEIEIYISPDSIVSRFDGSVNDSGMREVLRLVADLSMECLNLHAPMLRGDDSFSFRKRIGVLNATISLAARFGIPSVTLHPVHYAKSEEELEFALSEGHDARNAFLPGFEMIEQQAEEASVMFLIENVQHAADRTLVNGPSRMHLVLQAFSAPALVNLDLDHADSRLKAEFISKLGPKIAAVQVRELNTRFSGDIDAFTRSCPNLKLITIEGRCNLDYLEPLSKKVRSLNARHS
ncbi:MAG: TIM barrel protein [Candidatus Lokiarchaeota archaeon]|nr:TIM barrel protein [Candidatus Lokiarchaeota archaeon]